MEWVKKLGINNFSNFFSHDTLPPKIKKECGIVNLDDNQGPGTHWICYRNLENDFVEYFDPFGLIMPHEVCHYLITSRKKTHLLSGRTTKQRLCSLRLLVFVLLEPATKRKVIVRCYS